MRSVSLKQIAEAVGGRLEGTGRTRISNVCTDSRSQKTGGLFVALRGDRFDGHAFLKEASAAGAGAAMVESGNPHLRSFLNERPDFPVVVVGDTLRALGDMAAWVRAGLDIESIGITGSTGKTSVKDMLVSLLATRHSVVASPGSYNNEVGVPLTVLSATADNEVLVAEMGARSPGDIARLAEILRPRVGIITNIGVAHLELFGSQKQVARTKSELAAALPPDGVLVIKADDKWSDYLAGRTKARVIMFGHTRGAEYRYSRVRMLPGGYPSFRLSGPGFDLEVELPVIGRHQVENAVAAAACAHAVGLGKDDLASGLEKIRLSRWRTEVSHAPGGFVVVNDAYNASPQSMDAAIEVLRAVGGGRRTIAVLGRMAELGVKSEEYHLAVGRKVASEGVDILVSVGKGARAYVEAAVGSGMPKGSVFRCPDLDRAAELLQAIVEPGDVILLKGSRVVGLEDLAGRLLAGDFVKEKAE